MKNYSVGRKHLVIPDVQMKKGVPNAHMTWIGKYIVAKKPDVVVCIGDFADMPSLSSYDKGKKSYEGRRYVDDVESVVEAQRLLFAPLIAHNKKAKNRPYRPRLVMCLGNHEDRITRAVEEDAKLEGVIGIDDLEYEKFGWEVHPFLEVVVIDGIAYSHYFVSGTMLRPITTARALSIKKHMSCTMGHVQKTDIDMSQIRGDGKQIIGLFCGCCYLHDEEYLGPQGNSDRRQIVLKHEVEDGRYDPMMVSLKYLERRYS